MLRVLGKDFIIYGLSASIARFVGLFLVPIYTRIFTPEDYGTMDLISTVVAIISIFGMMQLESAVSRYFYSEKIESGRNRMISTAMWTILSLSLLLFFLLSAFSSFLSEIIFKSDQFSTIIVIAGLTIPVMNLNSLFTIIIRFKKKPLHYVGFQLLQMLITIGLTIYLVVFARIGIVGVFWGQIAGCLLITLVMARYLKEHLSIIWEGNELKKMMRYSLPMVPAVAGNWANSYLNRFVMLNYLSISEIGLYAVALKIASIIQLIGSSFAMAWPPLFWETYENNSNHKAVFKKAQFIISLLVLSMVVIITLFSDEMLKLFTTPAYFPAAKLVGFLVLALAISNIIAPLTAIGQGITKRTEFNTLIYFLSVAVNIGSLFLLVPLLGIIGVAISLLLGNLTLLTIGWYNSEKLYPVGFQKLPIFLTIIIVIAIIIVNIIFSINLYLKIMIALLILFYLIFTYRVILNSFLNKYIRMYNV